MVGFGETGRYGMALTSSRFTSEPRLRKASENTPALKQGDTGEGVAILQTALIDLGFAMPNSTHKGKTLPDGIFGAETAIKIREFQAAAGLVADGVVGRMTLSALETAVIAQTTLQARQFAAAARVRRFNS
ncbi:peptidoglycan-binding domain-containing protein [Bosea vaviloviae]|uniref:Peptidoglycan binding-like domain-containing protein n=1 Tax=Bosea vaviloviae TaxID=1526658 RepID=A0A1D7U4M7_9HYPH|nr:peptidoglycan-binding domain-containing protein [Bosea vaviloviae]AOO82292.1 hypothetical protein BHK69_19225 [Bosea vaviloviae]